MRVRDDGGNVTRVQKHVMIMTMKESYDMFRKMYPDVKTGNTSYRSCRPRQVRRISETSRRSCLCQVCCNVVLKAQALKQFDKVTADAQVQGKSSMTKQDPGNITLCPYEDEPAAKCLLRTYDSCGPKKPFRSTPRKA